MNILIIGSGGREHALSWTLAQSDKLSNLFIAPGNAGTSELGTNVDLSVSDFDGIGSFCQENNIEIVVVGPEVPLVEGIHDYFESKPELNKIAVIGPKKMGAQLEGSKKFSKEFMERHNIPTARYKAFTKETLEDSFAFLETLSPPYVLKADGLAAGKGVLSGESAATSALGKEGIIHGSKTLLMQSPDGQITEPYSISAGLDYPGIGPMHANLFRTGRAEFISITDADAMKAGQELAKLEGIIPAIESAHALAIFEDRKFKKEDIVVVNLSGRGDKDLSTYIDFFNL